MNEQIRLMALVMAKGIAVFAACVAVSGKPPLDGMAVKPTQVQGSHLLQPGVARVVPTTPSAS